MEIEKNLPKGYLLNYDGKSPNSPTQIEIKPDLSQQQEQNILKVIPSRLTLLMNSFIYIFSVTLYSNLFPNISWVWEIRAGKAERKKPTNGRSRNSNGKKTSRFFEAL